MDKITEKLSLIHKREIVYGLVWTIMRKVWDYILISNHLSWQYWTVSSMSESCSNSFQRVMYVACIIYSNRAYLSMKQTAWSCIFIIKVKFIGKSFLKDFIG